MTRDQAVEIINNIKYRTMTFRVRETYYGYPPRDDDNDTLQFRMSMYVKDVYTGEEVPLQKGVLVDLHIFDTEEKLLRHVFDEVIAFENHEAAEWFCYKGKQPFNPHVGEPGYDPHARVTAYDEKRVPLRQLDLSDYAMSGERMREFLKPVDPSLHESGGTAPPRPFLPNFGQIEERLLGNFKKSFEDALASSPKSFKRVVFHDESVFEKFPSAPPDEPQATTTVALKTFDEASNLTVEKLREAMRRVRDE